MNHKPHTLRMTHVARAARALTLLAGMAAPTWALAQLTFWQSPLVSGSSTASTGVIPNLIGSLDGNGLMFTDDAECSTQNSITDVNGNTYPFRCKTTQNLTPPNPDILCAPFYR
jgi:hypothetical protein